MSLPTTDNDWDLKSGSRDYFDNNPTTPTWSQNQDASPALKDVAYNLSQALGVPTNNGYLGLSGGYIYEESTAYKGPHAGIDFSAGWGTPIKAVVSGTVENVSDQGAGGFFIAVRGNDGKRWIYGHVTNESGLVKDQTIEAGQEVGRVFNQGTDSHLHLEVHTDFYAPATGFYQNNGNPASIAVLQQQTMSPLQAYWLSKNGGGDTPTQPTEGDDTITGTSDNDGLTGLGGNDELSGEAGDDRIYGEAGNDLLDGGAGNDYLDAYASFQNQEYDMLTGGFGVDTFVLGNVRQGIFYQGAGYATITDYSPQDDYIQLQGSASNYKLVNQGADTWIYLNDDSNDATGVIQGGANLNMSLTPQGGRMDFTFVI